MNTSEFEEAYEDKELIRGAIVTTPLSDLTLRMPILVNADATVVAAVDAMNEHRTGCVLVEENGKLAGIFTERDVLTKVIFRENNRSWTVRQVMTKSPETLNSDDSIAFALNKMSVGGYRHIPIVDRAGKPVGVVSVRDLVDFLVELFPDGVLNLPPSSDKGIPRSLDGG
ncbi:MAG: CBS domain-containing protein [Gemmataceae bacterium]|nr:CBS domain-containing protein [Gemmataceae bacterium]